MGIAIGLFITCSTIIYISFYHEEKSKAENDNENEKEEK